jgi:hypothetical protein
VVEFLSYSPFQRSNDERTTFFPDAGGASIYNQLQINLDYVLGECLVEERVILVILFPLFSGVMAFSFVSILN